MREIKQALPQPQGSCLCDVHLPYGEEFYADRVAAMQKAVEAHRNRFLQSIAAARPRIEAVK